MEPKSPPCINQTSLNSLSAHYGHSNITLKQFQWIKQTHKKANRVKTNCQMYIWEGHNRSWCVVSHSASLLGDISKYLTGTTRTPCGFYSNRPMEINMSKTMCSLASVMIISLETLLWFVWLWNQSKENSPGRTNRDPIQSSNCFIFQDTIGSP